MDNLFKQLASALALLLILAPMGNIAHAKEAAKASADFSPVYFQPIRGEVSYATMRQPALPTFNSQAPVPQRLTPSGKPPAQFFGPVPLEVRKVGGSPETNVNDHVLDPVWVVTVPVY